MRFFRYIFCALNIFLVSVSMTYAEDQERQPETDIPHINLYFKGLINFTEEDSLFQEKCAVCHGENMQGSGLGPSLIGVELQHGETLEEISRSVREGFPNSGMPDWSLTLSEDELRNMTLYVSESRQLAGISKLDNGDNPVNIPDDVIKTEQHNLKVEKVIGGLHNRPYSIAPLPRCPMVACW